MQGRYLLIRGFSEGDIYARSAVCCAEGEYGMGGDAGGRMKCAGGGTKVELCKQKDF